MEAQIEHCGELLEQEQYQELNDEVNKMIEEEREQEQEIIQKQEYIQEQERQLEQLKREDETLNEYIQEQYNHLEQEKQLLQQIETEIQIQKERENQLQIEQKLAAEQEQITLYDSFLTCHEYHQQNQILAQEIEGLKEDNDDLNRECQHLEGQSEQQIRYINCLKQLNQKTEETLSKLQVYQEELKQLLHKGKQDQGPKFDPIQFIKSVTHAQQEEDIQENQEDEQNSSFINEINQFAQPKVEEKKQEEQNLSFNYKYILIIAATVVAGIIIKKKLL